MMSISIFDAVLEDKKSQFHEKIMENVFSQNYCRYINTSLNLYDFRNVCLYRLG
jgi:hypothetical protein